MLVVPLIHEESCGYLVTDDDTGLACVIDPVEGRFEEDRLLARALGLQIVAAAETEPTVDGASACELFRDQLGAHYLADDGGAPCDLILRPGDDFRVGALRFDVIAAQGGIALSVAGRIFGDGVEIMVPAARRPETRQRRARIEFAPDEITR